MNSQQPQFKFYATLLDAFQWYRDSEQETAFQDLINKINRVPFSSEAADKGTAFNEIVDKVAHGNVELEQMSNEAYFGGFSFKRSIVEEIASEVKGAIPQVYCKGYLQTRYGLVELYGYIDELMPFPTIVDIKCTGNYDYGKFTKNWQHIVYPFCLHQQNGVNYQFTYLITDYQRTFSEDYFFNPETDTIRLRSFVEEFIDFLLQHKELITDKKVFGGENIVAA